MPAKVTPKVPSEAVVQSWFKKYSNWGRWGKEDQLGTLNHITPQKRVAAARLVKDGTSVTCSRLLSTEISADVRSPLIHYMSSSGERWSGQKSKPGEVQGSSDFFGIAFHGYHVTHIDSLAHIGWDGHLYNGRPGDLITTREGATVESIDLLKDGVVSRGVLLDIPPVRGVKWLEPKEGVYAEDLEAAEKKCGVKVEPGDVLFVRCGILRRRNELGPTNPTTEGIAGLHASTIPFLYERGVAMLGSDAPTDMSPTGYQHPRMPVHQVGIAAMGLWLIDNANLEDLAAACQAKKRWEFMIAMGPLRLHNTTGCPINPIAVF